MSAPADIGDAGDQAPPSGDEIQVGTGRSAGAQPDQRGNE
jgi:hypothetical protein